MITASGYNDKLGLLLQKVAQELRTFGATDRQTFDRVHEALTRSYRNFFMGKIGSLLVAKANADDSMQASRMRLAAIT